MNPSPTELSPLDHEMLDRLVDGELSEGERRELLARLDRVAGGWRACAISFLEAQCLEEAFGEMPGPSAAGLEPVVPPETAAQRSGLWPKRIQTALAMAASFLVTLGIGWWAGGLRFESGTGALDVRPSDGLAMDAIRAPGKSALRPNAAANSSETPNRSPTMVVALPSGVAGQEIRVPVVEGDEHDHSLMFPDTAAFPARFRDALERAGYQVRQSRELLPIPVQGGRHAIVPVDQLDVHYVGSHVE
jgi:hypothetical protein